jgi:hypothetical protein
VSLVGVDFVKFRAVGPSPESSPRSEVNAEINGKIKPIRGWLRPDNQRADGDWHLSPSRNIPREETANFPYESPYPANVCAVMLNV